MLLEEDETEFEYLGDKGQSEEAKVKRRERELREVEGRRKKLGVGVRFTGAAIKISSGSEVEEAAVKLRLEGKDFVNQTLRTLSLCAGSRMEGTLVERVGGGGKSSCLEWREYMSPEP